MADFILILCLMVALSIGVLAGVVLTGWIVRASDPVDEIDTTYDSLHRFVHSALSLPDPPKERAR